ncbi:MAG: helix-turn-helix transcriptional regulator [Clostridia bacterium]|nr:helix-turn-helix transcriptional regulator [Clostridia bacterium]
MYKFPERLKSLMVEFNVNQVQLSKETKISQATIARWLANQRIPTALSIIALANYFKCSADYLLGLSD